MSYNLRIFKMHKKIPEIAVNELDINWKYLF